jgi:hypothetical protein
LQLLDVSVQWFETDELLVGSCEKI